MSERQLQLTVLNSNAQSDIYQLRQLRKLFISRLHENKSHEGHLNTIYCSAEMLYIICYSKYD